MANRSMDVDTPTSPREGHGDDSYVPSLKKGTFMDGGGTYVDLPAGNQAISPNRKSGPSSGGEQ